MKKQIKLVAVVATLLIAAGMLVIQSCKKDQSKLNGTQNVQSTIKHPEKIDDINAYLRDFGEKMKNAKSDEVLTLEEASWHLTAYQNYRFGDVDDDYSNIVYDEKEYMIHVTDGVVTLADLGVLYTSTAEDIRAFYKNTNFDGKKIKYVYSKIDAAGKVKVRMALTYTESAKYYYFHYDNWADSVEFCTAVFPDQFGYACYNKAPDTLTDRILTYGPNTLHPSPNGRIIYIDIIEETYTYLDYPGRIFYDANCTYNTPIMPEDMCFYLDSYLGILVENEPVGYEICDCIVVPKCESIEMLENPNVLLPIYHELHAYYGCYAQSPEPPGY